jgi:hypothetical protein
VALRIFSSGAGGHDTAMISLDHISFDPVALWKQLDFPLPRFLSFLLSPPEFWHLCVINFISVLVVYCTLHAVFLASLCGMVEAP